MRDRILGENIKSGRKPPWHVAKSKPPLPKNLRDLASDENLDNKLRLDTDQKKKFKKYGLGLVGLLSGHEWILTALPVLRRFIASNVTAKSKSPLVDIRSGPPLRQPVGSVSPTMSWSQSVSPQAKALQINKTRKSGSKSVLVGFVGIAAFVGLFVLLDQRDGSSSKITSKTTELISGQSEEPILNSLPAESWESLARSIAYIQGENETDAWSGSGTLIIDGSYVLTNFHVTPGPDSSYSVFFTDSFEDSPNEGYSARYVIGDELNDLAIIQIIDESGYPVFMKGRTIIKPADVAPSLGEELTNIGYPSVGFGDTDGTVTITRGGYSGKLNLNSDGFNGEYFKTDGMLSFGVSGGATFNSKFEFVGVPSGGNTDDDSSAAIGYIKPARYAADLIAKVRE